MCLANDVFAALFIGSFIALVSVIYWYGIEWDEEGGWKGCSWGEQVHPTAFVALPSQLMTGAVRWPVSLPASRRRAPAPASLRPGPWRWGWPASSCYRTARLAGLPCVGRRCGTAPPVGS